MEGLPNTLKKKSSRIISLDLLRGFFLLIILFDHLNYYPNGFDFFTGRGSYFVSAAEGFFIISGLVLGYVRGAKLKHEPMTRVMSLLLRRALILYLACIVTDVLFLIIGWTFTGNPGVKPEIPPVSNWLWALWETISLQKLHGWTDYLKLYAIFMAFSPLVIWLLRRRRWYIAVLLTFSIWLLRPHSTDPGIQPISWQILFFLPMVAGYYLPALRTRWNTLHPIYKHSIISALLLLFFSSFALAAVGQFISVHHNADSQFWRDITSFYDTINRHFDKMYLAWPRLLMSFVWFLSGWIIVAKFEPFILKHLRWPILAFGQNSLYTYIIEGFVVFLLHLIFPIQAVSDAAIMTGHYWLILLYHAAICLLAISIVLFAIHKKFLMRIIPR